MTEESKCCEQGQDPKYCSAEQIRICHGDDAEHKCESEGEQPEAES